MLSACHETHIYFPALNIGIFNSNICQSVYVMSLMLNISQLRSKLQNPSSRMVTDALVSVCLFQRSDEQPLLNPAEAA